jgi:hypothetical protein
MTLLILFNTTKKILKFLIVGYKLISEEESQKFPKKFAH